MFDEMVPSTKTPHRKTVFPRAFGIVEALPFHKELLKVRVAIRVSPK
jgi:hypothetical protein